MIQQRRFKVLHLFAGIGGGALGFQQAQDEYKSIHGSFRTLAGIDVDPKACEDFGNLTGAKAVCMDLFERRDYIAFHGYEPWPTWKEVGPADIKAATGGEYPDVVFLSPPCKGFSGLLPQKSAETEKYKALNRLVVRGIFLTLEAFRDNLPAVFLLENVPRIKSRGKSLLNTVKGMLQSYGYVTDDRDHDCGEIGALAQHRKRYLLIARNPTKMMPFIYQPIKHRVKTIGEVLGPLPLPDDPSMGPMHRLPRLQWKTWVRLALIPAGGDWRDLEHIEPEQYRLKYLPQYAGHMGVMDWWRKPAGTVTGNMCINGSTAAAVADPRLKLRESRHAAVYQVVKWNEPANTVTGTRFGSGVPAISDPRLNERSNRRNNSYLVRPWDEAAFTITGEDTIGSGAQSISDPRTGFKPSTHTAIYQVRNWEEEASTVTGALRPNNGAISIADPRFGCSARNEVMGVQSWDEPGKTVTGSDDIHSGSAAVADPRILKDNETLDPPPVIIALDGTWHRPLTTVELAALQGFPIMINGQPLKLAGNSDARWREAIGNAVPPPAAKAMAKVVLYALLVASAGITWEMSAEEIWVSPDSEEILNVY